MFCQQLFRLPFRHLRCLVVDNHRHIISPFRAPSSLDRRLLSSCFLWELFTCRRKCLYAPNATRLLFKSGKVCFILPPHARDRPFAIVIHLHRRLSFVLRLSVLCLSLFQPPSVVNHTCLSNAPESLLSYVLCHPYTFLYPMLFPSPNVDSLRERAVSSYRHGESSATRFFLIRLPISLRYAADSTMLRCATILRRTTVLRRATIEPNRR